MTSVVVFDVGVFPFFVFHHSDRIDGKYAEEKYTQQFTSLYGVKVERRSRINYAAATE